MLSHTYHKFNANGLFVKSFAIITVLLLLTQSSQVQLNKIPKIIWMYWQDASQISFACQLCIQNTKKLTEQQGWKVIIVDNSTFYDYIEDDKYFDFIMENNKLTLEIANKVDVIRLFLLYQNGGVWMDISTVLTESLQWLSKLNYNQEVYNRPFIQNQNKSQQNYPQVFLFTNKGYGSNRHQNRQKNSNQKEDRTVYPFPGFQTWFIAAVPKAKFIQDWKKQFTSYFIKDYDYYLQNMLEKNIFSRGVDTNTYMVTSGALQHVIQAKQEEFDRNLVYLEQRKFAVDYYKIWFIWSQQGPFIFLDYYRGTQIAVDFDIQYLKKINLFPKYFLKLTGWWRRGLQNHLRPLQRILKQQNNSSSKFKVVRNSILEQFLLSRLKQQQLKYIQPIQFNQTAQYKQFCYRKFFFEYIDLRLLLLFIIILGSVLIDYRQRQREPQKEKIEKNEKEAKKLNDQ